MKQDYIVTKVQCDTTRWRHIKKIDGDIYVTDALERGEGRGRFREREVGWVNLENDKDKRIRWLHKRI